MLFQILTGWVISATPVGILFLVAEKVAVVKDFGEMFKGLGAYFGTVLLGIFIHGFVILPTIYGNTNLRHNLIDFICPTV